jgi:hypothetical protein
LGSVAFGPLPWRRRRWKEREEWGTKEELHGLADAENRTALLVRAATAVGAKACALMPHSIPVKRPGVSTVQTPSFWI